MNPITTMKEITHVPIQRSLFISSSYPENGEKKAHYKNETIQKIVSSSDVQIENTTVEKTVLAGNGIIGLKTSAKKLKAGGNIFLVNCTIENKLTAKGSITVNGSTQLGKIKASGSVALNTCSNVQSVTCNHVSLINSTIHGDVTAKNVSTIENTLIFGKLTCSSKNLHLKKSSIETIVVHCFEGLKFNSESCRISIEKKDLIFKGFSLAAETHNVLVDVFASPEQIFINGIPLNLVLSETTDKKKEQTITLEDSNVKQIIFEGCNGQVVLKGERSSFESITGNQVC